MTRKKRRLYMLGLALLGLGAATALSLTAFEDNIVFFFSPTQLQTQNVGSRNFRLGGLVEKGSVHKLADGVTTEFLVTDTVNTVPVTYRGQLPDLFREGQGIVAEGKMVSGTFQAREVLAKHDEKYMPPEVADALKQAEHFKANQQTQADAQPMRTDTLKPTR